MHKMVLLTFECYKLTGKHLAGNVRVFRVCYGNKDCDILSILSIKLIMVFHTLHKNFMYIDLGRCIEVRMLLKNIKIKLCLSLRRGNQ